MYRNDAILEVAGSRPDVGKKFCNSGVAKTSKYPLTDTGLLKAAGAVGHGSLKPSNPLPLMTIENGDRPSRLNLSNAVGGLMVSLYETA